VPSNVGSHLDFIALATWIAVATSVDATVALAAAAPQLLRIPLGLDAYMPVPEDNAITAEKIALDRRLFFDTGLSRDGRTSCSSCHQPERAFTDGRPVSVGVFGRQGVRSVPTLVNRGYGTTQFWDGRRARLEDQVLDPIQDQREMDATLSEVLARLRRSSIYRGLFGAAFGGDPSSTTLARALATYVRTILAGDAPVDRYLGGDRQALTAGERDGLQIFRGKGNCNACHLGPTFSDERFHNTGIAWRQGIWTDLGRATATMRDADRGAFKTPTLRQVAGTAPYMHAGSLPALDAVIDFYDRGGNPNQNLDPEVRPLGLSPGEKAALASFLRALTGTISEGESNVRSGNTERVRQPEPER
jgi:cytochrome c peroxidase